LEIILTITLIGTYYNNDFILTNGACQYEKLQSFVLYAPTIHTHVLLIKMFIKHGKCIYIYIIYIICKLLQSVCTMHAIGHNMSKLSRKTLPFSEKCCSFMKNSETFAPTKNNKTDCVIRHTTTVLRRFVSRNKPV
jgi:hypothetical protein